MDTFRTTAVLVIDHAEEVRDLVAFLIGPRAAPSLMAFGYSQQEVDRVES